MLHHILDSSTLLLICLIRGLAKWEASPELELRRHVRPPE